MRALNGLMVLSLCFLSTCTVSERQYPLPQVAEEDKQTEALCIGEVTLFTDGKFQHPLEKDHSLARKAESAKAEAEATLWNNLEKEGFKIGSCDQHDQFQMIHLTLDIGLRIEFFTRFFIVARIRGTQKACGKDRLLFELLAETEVFDSTEREVRRAGRELAAKLARGLKEVLAPKPH